MVGFDDVEISDESDDSDEVTSIKQIALLHIKKISNIMIQELTGGYWEKKPVKTGSGIFMAQTYKPDLRAAYCNAVGFLCDIVYPNADKKFRDIADILYKEEDSIKDIKEKIKKFRVLFREINNMFERMNYFDSYIGRTEGEGY